MCEKEYSDIQIHFTIFPRTLSRTSKSNQIFIDTGSEHNYAGKLYLRRMRVYIKKTAVAKLADNPDVD